MSPFRRFLLLTFALCLLVSGFVQAHFRLKATAENMRETAQQFAASLSAEQKAKAVLAYDAPNRLDWHFIPKPMRKGLQIRDMNADQRRLAHSLLQACLSDVGYAKAVKIMELEELLRVLELEKKGAPLRDTERYYFTLFGDPAVESRWGLSVEGHHLSLNFVVEKDSVVSVTPLALCANPAIIKSNKVPSIPEGQQILALEEQVAMELVNSLSAEQLKVALLNEKADAEVRTPGSPQPVNEKPQGLAFDKLDAAQQANVSKLLNVYIGNLPSDVADKAKQKLLGDALQTVHFAWTGGRKIGEAHGYRVQGPTFLIEFVNTQPDAAGNPANHIHAVWRSLEGDFALPIASK